MPNEDSQLQEQALVARTKIHLEPGDTASGAGAGYYAPGDKLPDDLHGHSAEEFIAAGSAALEQPLKVGPSLSAEQLAELGGLLPRVKIRLEKYHADSHEDSETAAADEAVAPDEVVESEDNLLLIGGASALWHRVTGGTTVGAFSNANAQLGVGDSTTAAADTQTDLQAATNKTWKAMDATYPQHTDSTGSSGSKAATFRATFGTGDANYAWNEWGIRNSDGTPRLFNRKVESLGTKTAGSTWVLTVTPALA